MTLSIQHTVRMWKEADSFVTRALPLGVMSCGQNPDEARRNLAEAVALFLKTAAAHGTFVELLEKCGYVRADSEWRAPKLLLSETVTQAVNAQCPVSEIRLRGGGPGRGDRPERSLSAAALPNARRASYQPPRASCG